MSSGYTLRHDELYVAQLNQIGTPRSIDEALAAIEWALSSNPEQFPIVPGTQRLRVAKTEPYQRGLVSVPPLRIWFSIENDNIVLLRSAEILEDWDTPDSG